MTCRKKVLSSSAGSRVGEITVPDPQAHFLDGPELPLGITRFWLVRHGVVEVRARQTMYGTLDVPLCVASRQAHQQAYQSLAQKLPQTDLWFTSPLKRAYETGKAIQEAGCFSIPMKKEEAFKEQSLGAWNGVSHERFLSIVQQAPHPFWSIATEERPPQGESMYDVYQRIGHALTRLTRCYEGRDMVVLSHGGAIRMALAYALKISPDQALYFTVQNLSYSILEYISGQWRVVSVNVLPDFGTCSRQDNEEES